ncbi:chemotaxis protein methyltransferase CheR [Breznakibacter xylanolyticus]|uniref:Chemotaxis protein methyltransferase CheR n=1 Tax=Breznakibacter xylanolyticus TaxID=990 RepID=A0A2W7NEZ5_9BACT|nr:CheR family methyltransferase [Breznakibacter xylanolyticus]MBN2744611.1 protein-glutamate O-methyltransferase CheR [Marinilabiliaceae bacterium]PZX16717.1 chemotaxis protein methyltransferase CheR [Breznakibacter xylanolyticus]
MTYKEYLLELKKYSPYDFSEYSDNSIQRRLQKVLDEYKMTLEELRERTINDNLFVEQLVNDITVNTTDFFRDADIWLEYVETVLNKLSARQQIKIWHAGSSTGKEVYSNLILLDELGILKKTQVFATDINQQVLKEATQGTYRYSNNIKSIETYIKILEANKDNSSIKSINLEKHFNINIANDQLKVNNKYLSLPIFKKHDLVQGAIPFEEKFDIIFCRNVLIYFNTSLQTRILKIFHDHLNTSGVLILGNHEGLTGFFKTRFNRLGSFFVKSNSFHFKY